MVPDSVSSSPQRFRDDEKAVQRGSTNIPQRDPGSANIPQRHPGNTNIPQRHPGSANIPQRHPGNRNAIVRDPREGNVLPTKLDESPLAVERQLPDELLHTPADTIRAVAGPQTEFFTNEAIERFFANPWHIAPNSDRMGYRLGGGTVEVENAGSMISEAVSPGSVQIPAGGEPIVLMADCGTVGGYPKIATVISVDRGRLAQLRVGAEFKFEESTVESAQARLREEELRLHSFQDANSRS